MRLFDEDSLRRFGQRLSESDLEILVPGYVIYFKSKGLLG
jgi:hypothetical protein